MKKFFNKNSIIGLSFLGLFLLLIILLQFDKNIITISGKEVGLSHINDLIDYKSNKKLDIISDILLYTSFIVAIAGVVIGLYQLITRKSLFKVDSFIIIFGIFLVAAVILWILFDYVIKINYRPLNPNEGSFPSTHVLLTVFLTNVGGLMLAKYCKNTTLIIVAYVVSLLFIILVVLFRILSGMHYITDVFGGLFLGFSLSYLFNGIKIYIENGRK